MKTELANYLNAETEKLKAKQRAERPKPRKSWGELNPVTRVAPSKKDKKNHYSRQKEKISLGKLSSV